MRFPIRMLLAILCYDCDKFQPLSSLVRCLRRKIRSLSESGNPSLNPLGLYDLNSKEPYNWLTFPFILTRLHMHYLRHEGSTRDNFAQHNQVGTLIQVSCSRLKFPSIRPHHTDLQLGVYMIHDGNCYIGYLCGDYYS